MNKASPFLLIYIVALAFNSCQQCNHAPKEITTEKKDTLGIPTLDEVNAEIKKDSINPALYYKRAHINETNNEIKSALTDMFLALTLDSLRPEYYLYTANLFKKSGDLSRGIVLMSKAIATDSMNIDFYVKGAELAYIDTAIKGNYKIAMDYLNAAILKNPQNADIYFYKGNVFKELHDTARAISAFQTATELNPKYYDAYMQIGLLLENKKDKNAQKYFDNAIKVSNKPEDALYAKANILKDEGTSLESAEKDAQAAEKFKGAIENFRKVIEINSRNVEAYMGIAFSYYQMDSVEDAYKYYSMATQIEPTYAGAYFSKGLCAEDLGHTKEAIALYQTCLNLDPHFTRAEQHIKKLQGTSPQ
jgi:tetratricopeptide (TPR) repeat protein